VKRLKYIMPMFIESVTSSSLASWSFEVTANLMFETCFCKYTSVPMSSKNCACWVEKQSFSDVPLIGNWGGFSGSH